MLIISISFEQTLLNSDSTTFYIDGTPTHTFSQVMWSFEPTLDIVIGGSGAGTTEYPAGRKTSHQFRGCLDGVMFDDRVLSLLHFSLVSFDVFISNDDMFLSND